MLNTSASQHKNRVQAKCMYSDMDVSAVTGSMTEASHSSIAGSITHDAHQANLQLRHLVHAPVHATNFLCCMSSGAGQQGQPCSSLAAQQAGTDGCSSQEHSLVLLDASCSFAQPSALPSALLSMPACHCRSHTLGALQLQYGKDASVTETTSLNACTSSLHS